MNLQTKNYAVTGDKFGAIIGFARCKRHAKRVYRKFYPSDKIMSVSLEGKFKTKWNLW